MARLKTTLKRVGGVTAVGFAPRREPRRRLTRCAYKYPVCGGCVLAADRVLLPAAGTPGAFVLTKDEDLCESVTQLCDWLMRKATCLLQHECVADSDASLRGTLHDWLEATRCMDSCLEELAQRLTNQRRHVCQAHEAAGRRPIEHPSSLPMAGTSAGGTMRTLCTTLCAADAAMQAPVCTVLKLALTHCVVPDLQHVYIRPETHASLRHFIDVFTRR
jgi:hypothetical protein